MKQRKAGIREAKKHFSALIHDVRAGHEWVISDRGTAVARVVPIPLLSGTLEERLRNMEERGLITRRKMTPEDREFWKNWKPLECGGEEAQRFLQEDREDRV